MKLKSILSLLAASAIAFASASCSDDSSKSKDNNTGNGEQSGGGEQTGNGEQSGGGEQAGGEQSGGGEQAGGEESGGGEQAGGEESGESTEPVITEATCGKEGTLDAHLIEVENIIETACANAHRGDPNDEDNFDADNEFYDACYDAKNDLEGYKSLFLCQSEAADYVLNNFNATIGDDEFNEDIENAYKDCITTKVSECYKDGKLGSRAALVAESCNHKYDCAASEGALEDMGTKDDYFKDCIVGEYLGDNLTLLGFPKCKDAYYTATDASLKCVVNLTCDQLMNEQGEATCRRNTPTMAACMAENYPDNTYSE